MQAQPGNPNLPGKVDLIIRAELIRCAARVASLVFEDCQGFDKLAADASPANRLAAGDKYLDKGTLYVAKFNEDFSGEWLRLADVAQGTEITPRRPGSRRCGARRLRWQAQPP